MSSIPIIKPRFTPEQIHAELQAQGIRSTKGEIGSFLLYKNLLLSQSEGKTSLASSIFTDLGINPGNYRNESFTCGEFRIYHGTFISKLFNIDFKFEVIRAVDQAL